MAGTVSLLPGAPHGVCGVLEKCVMHAVDKSFAVCQGYMDCYMLFAHELICVQLAKLHDMQMCLGSHLQSNML